MHPYKIRVVHELLPGDGITRLHYCHWFMKSGTRDGDELDDWNWSDEAWFHLDGYVNSQNSRIWSTENPHALHESPLHARKVGVWCAMSRRRIFITFFHDSVNSERYITMVEQFVATLIR
jgi:hypothetical protein